MEDNSALRASLDMDMNEESDSGHTGVMASSIGMPDSLYSKTGDSLLDDRIRQMHVGERKEYTHKELDSGSRQARDRYVAEILTLGGHYNMSSLTSHGAVAMFDHLFGLYRFDSKHLQLLAISCWWLSAKFHETEQHLPALQTVLHQPPFRFHPVVFTKKDVNRWEIAILGWINWKVDRVVPVQFVETYLHLGIIFPGDKLKGHSVKHRHEYDAYAKKYARYLCDVAIQDYDMGDYLPSVQAAAVIAATRRALKITPDWRPELEHLVGVSPEEVEEAQKVLWKNYEQRHSKLALSVAQYYESGALISPKDVSSVSIP